jgi:type VII secretion-associated serine protease mycosin
MKISLKSLLCGWLTIIIALLTIPAMAPGAAAEDGQWYLAALDIQKVHQLARGRGVVVAVVDTGVNPRDPSLVGRVLPGADFTLDETASTGSGNIDLNGHGTGMASLIAGTNTVQGIAPDALILPVRVKIDEGIVDSSSSIAIASGIRWAVDNEADVISISLASPVADPRERSAVEYALAQGITIVAGAGNSDHASGVQFPARYEGVIAVCATNSQGKHSQISVTGPELTICAPGERILHAGKNADLVLGTGTSDSTAIVSSVVALILERYPRLSPSEVGRRLTATAVDIGAPGRDSIYGFGIVNPLRAIAENPPTVNTSSDTFPSTLKSSAKAGVGIGAWALSSTIFGLALVTMILLAGGLIALILLRKFR